jgi:hypothetical protein
LCAALASANAGLLGASIAAPALAYGAAPALAYGAAAPTLGSTFHGNAGLAYGAAPALAYGAAAPVLGSTYHGNAGLAYGAAPALAYGAAAPVLGSTFHGRLAGPAVAYGAPALAAPAITSQSSNILRSFGNLGQVSTYSKSIDTPYSSVRKADIRVSNPGVRIAAAAPALAYGAAPALSTYHGSYASPVLRTAVAAPAISTYHGAALAAPAIATPALGALGVAYSAAPAVSHINYASSYANYAW